MLKRLIKYTVAVFLYYSGLLAFLDRLQPRRALHPDMRILMYHRVLPISDRQYRYTQPGLACTPEIFGRQMQFLSERYNLISAAALVELLRNNQPIPPGTVIVTFDDGWRDNYVHAFPILQQYRVPATIFLATDFIETDRLFWFLKAGLLLSEGDLSVEKIDRVFSTMADAHPQHVNELSAGLHLLGTESWNQDAFMEWLKQFEPDLIEEIINSLAEAAGIAWADWSAESWILSWNEIREMDRDIVEFGSHGCSHGILTRLRQDQVKRELAESKRKLEQELGHEITVFAYPNGDYNASVERMVKEAGYHGAIIVGSGDPQSNVDLFALPRSGAHDGMSIGPLGGFSKALFAFELRR
jgi:peptidoglycan/xylan/chitin deacetylase (PgdA/CDA1 family)